MLQHCPSSSYCFSPQPAACVAVHSWHKQRSTIGKLRSSILTDVQFSPQRDLSGYLLTSVSHASVSFRKWKTISDIWTVFISSPLLSCLLSCCSNAKELLRSWAVTISCFSDLRPIDRWRCGLPLRHSTGGGEYSGWVSLTLKSGLKHNLMVARPCPMSQTFATKRVFLIVTLLLSSFKKKIIGH